MKNNTNSEYRFQRKSIEDMTDAEFTAFNARQRFEMLLVATGRVKNFRAAEQLGDKLTDEQIAAQTPELEQLQSDLIEHYSNTDEGKSYLKL